VRRSYSGGAKPAYLTTNLGGTTGDLTIECDDLSNWPTGSPGPFYIVINRGLVTEEKILCVSRTGNIMYVYDTGLTTGRGADGTTISSHALGSEVEHVFTATDADEANSHVNSASGVHGVAGSVVGTTDAQTLTNKTLASATLSGTTVFTGTTEGIDLTSPFLLMGA